MTTIVKDKKGNDVSVGDVVKVAYKKDLYKIHKIVEVDEGEDGKSYPILELAFNTWFPDTKYK